MEVKDFDILLIDVTFYSTHVVDIRCANKTDIECANRNLKILIYSGASVNWLKGYQSHAPGYYHACTNCMVHIGLTPEYCRLHYSCYK